MKFVTSFDEDKVKFVFSIMANCLQLRCTQCLVNSNICSKAFADFGYFHFLLGCNLNTFIIINTISCVNKLEVRIIRFKTYI